MVDRTNLEEGMNAREFLAATLRQASTALEKGEPLDDVLWRLSSALDHTRRMASTEAKA